MNTVPCLIAERQDREVLSEECLRSAIYFLSHLRFTRETNQVTHTWSVSLSAIWRDRLSARYLVCLTRRADSAAYGKRHRGKGSVGGVPELAARGRATAQVREKSPRGFRKRMGWHWQLASRIEPGEVHGA